MGKNKIAEAVKAAVNSERAMGNEPPPPPPPPPKPEPLAPCPCGKVPESLMLELPNPPIKYGRAIGQCCGIWGIEFFNAYQTGEDTIRLATEAWNSAVRG
jgi:hypothetical protein